MIRLAQVHVLTAGRAGQTGGEFRPDECAADREQPAEHPDAENQKRRMHAVSDLGRIGKNSRAHDAAHHDHRRVKQPKPTTRLRFRCHVEPSRDRSRANRVVLILFLASPLVQGERKKVRDFQVLADRRWKLSNWVAPKKPSPSPSPFPGRGDPFASTNSIRAMHFHFTAEHSS